MSRLEASFITIVQGTEWGAAPGRTWQPALVLFPKALDTCVPNDCLFSVPLFPAPPHLQTLSGVCVKTFWVLFCFFCPWRRGQLLLSSFWG